MIRFNCDYLEGAHPRIIEKLTETNFVQTPGCGEDEYCERARAIIREKCGAPEAYVQFLVGGTQTNTTVIASVLRPYQGVLSANTGHINAHETGAIEATGHKVLALPSEDGKVTAAQVQEAYEEHWADASHEHIVQPGMVYISHPTENGTLYKKEELKSLYETCKKLDLPLFLDGARLGYGLMSEGTDITWEDLAAYTDVFYIGGTKVGAMFGEAVVITKKDLIPHFFTMIKQHGALLAKGFLLGVQFDILFTDNLYFEISKDAIETAMYLKQKMLEKGHKLYLDSPTNQQFFIVENEKLKEWDSKVGYCFIEKYDSTHTVVRFATSWATKMDDVERLIENLE